MADWLADALCAPIFAAGYDPWFPTGRGHDRALQVRDAVKVCGQCPVADRCLEHALAQGLDRGVFGGLDEDARAALKRRRARALRRQAPAGRRLSQRPPSVRPAVARLRLPGRRATTPTDVTTRKASA